MQTSRNNLHRLLLSSHQSRRLVPSLPAVRSIIHAARRLTPTLSLVSREERHHHLFITPSSRGRHRAAGCMESVL
ncbi:hypothetical protein CgunFtcFv8_015911 [Champsocephalus gunnari]|uniref:Uncharacterized protein n=1 Tax=Champsocephalus gunnari TaxID=52237 RepID=A0AAN8CBE2_CHAGU|nr:hypothetical protein CgunFtcFv8_015911 [Champsocephalus gunnari]